jgi:asparagine synthase (glutamine-hydrolysing)
MYISELARKNGMKVLLSGAGGDDVFSGYRRHQALRFHRLFERLPVPLIRAAAGLAGRVDQRGALGRRLSRLLGAASYRGNEGIARYFPWIAEERLLELYTPEARAELADARAIDPLVEFLAAADPSTSPLSRMLALEQRFFLADFNLIFTDKMSMAHGVEVRVPFLDMELAAFAARIPDAFRVRGSEGKWVLKRAMEPYLPKDVIYRAKTGFGGPMRRWLQEGLRPLLEDTLSPETLRRRGLFDPDAVRRLIRANDTGAMDASYALVALISVELWCQAYLDTALPVATC